MSTRFLSTVCAVAMLVFGVVMAADAGWVMKDRNGDVTLISDGKIKSQPETPNDVWHVFDIKSGQLMIVNPKGKSYSQGTFSEYCDAMVAMRDKMMGAMAPEQKAMMEQMMKQGRPERSPKVSVSRQGDGGSVAGLATTKYKVMVDGELYEEVWLAREPGILKEIGNVDKLIQQMTEFQKCTASMAGPGFENEPENSKEYIGLAREGFELKRVRYDGGEPDTETDIVSAERKDLPASEFRAPSGYKKVRFDDLMQTAMDQE